MTEITSMQRNRLAGLAVSERGFVFDPQSGQSFSANGVALALLALLRAGADEEAATSRLAAQFDQRPALVRPAVAAFLRQLTRYFP
ncbi:PqqD family peptide modification chaperone [uncultured Rhodoblastus sp.]|uniref:PqqD family peptide modification chaperone n=1 Tax=uncultured Rhodoblastus sp. TaxID=543037 RepID=UPI0025D7969E|nr:PqqD family peptide modification chaperone [uncultured Rhodoblastus sp.]